MAKTRDEYERAFGDEQRGLMMGFIAEILHARPGIRFDDLVVGRATTNIMRRLKELNDRIHVFYSDPPKPPQPQEKANGTAASQPIRK